MALIISLRKSGLAQGLALMLPALALRVARLSFQPLWWDEGWSLYFATSDPRSMLALTAVDIHPPLYYLLLHLWIRLFGPGVLSVRLLSVVIGTAAVPLLFLIGRRLLGAKGGLLAAFLLALSPFAVYYSQEVRMYGLVMLLGLAAWYFAVKWALGDGGIAGLGGYVAAATAALYTQYYAAFLLLALNLVIIFAYRPGAKRTAPPAARRPGGEEKPRPSRLLPWLGAQLAVGLLFAPWLLYAAPRLATYVHFKVGVEGDRPYGLLTYPARHLAAFQWGHAEGALAEFWWVGLLPLAVLLLLLARKYIGHLPPTIKHWSLNIDRWSSVILTVTLTCGFIVNLLLPFNPPRVERLLLLALPAFLLLFAQGLLALHRRMRWPLAAFVVLAAVSLAFFYTVPRYPEDDYRPLAERIRALALPSDAILCVHPWQVGYFASYLPDEATRPALFLTPRQVLPRERQMWADDPTRMAADLDDLLAEHRRLWFPEHQAMGRILEEQVDAYLTQKAYPTLREWYGENTVLAFFVAGEPQSLTATARFGDWLQLEGAALTPGPLESAWGVAAVDLTWRVTEPPAEEYTVGLRLVGPTGHLWAQRDAPPSCDFQAAVGVLRPDHHGLPIPAGTPPGDYRLTLRVYRSDDVAVLPVVFQGGSGGEVTLGTVRVARPRTPPPPEALEIAERRDVPFGDRLRFLGFNAPQERSFLPGEAVPVYLFWQALAAPGEDFLPRLRLLDEGGDVLAELTEKPVAGTYPTAWWQAGELVRDPHDLPIPAAVPPGRYRLTLSLVRAADGRPVEPKGGDASLFLTEVEVRDRARNYRPPTPRHAQQATFGPGVALIGYDLDPDPPRPDAPYLAVTLYWHALTTPDRNYFAFVHLLDAEGRIVAQHDGTPGEGAYPTLGWLPGEYLTDRHLIPLPPDLPPGTYRLAVGLYDPTNGQRLGERVVLNDQWRKEE